MSIITPSFRLDGKRALITGAGRGIGRAIAQAYAASGAEVTLCARTRAEIEEAAAELTAAGFAARALVADVTDAAGFAQIIDGLGAFDVFVNNAGTNRPKPLSEVTEDDYDTYRCEGRGEALTDDTCDTFYYCSIFHRLVN